jgi:hypothetical protein
MEDRTMAKHKMVRVENRLCDGCDYLFDNIEAPDGICPECGSHESTPKPSYTGEYLYRGCIIERNDDVPSGYWGRWQWGSKLATTRRELVNIIDKRMNEPAGRLLEWMAIK